MSIWGGCCRLNRVPEKEWARYPGPSSVFVLRHCRSELRGIYQILQGCFLSPSLWNHNLHGCEISVVVYQWESYLEKRVTEKNVAKENRDNEMSKYVVYESKYQFPKLVSFTHTHIYKYSLNCCMKYICIPHRYVCVSTQVQAHVCRSQRLMPGAFLNQTTYRNFLRQALSLNPELMDWTRLPGL